MALENVWAGMLAQVQKNTLQDYGIASGIFLGILLVIYGFKLYALTRLKKLARKSDNSIDDAVLSFIDSIGWPPYLSTALTIAVSYLETPPFVFTWLLYITIGLVIVYAIKGFFSSIDTVADAQIRRRPGESSFPVRVMGIFAKAAIVTVAVLLVLSNLGINITSLVASLGIGGLAIAFALQNVLQDLFSSFSIYFDKPFRKGDFIIIGSDMGTVKEIGIKSTRIQTLQGQELVVSNRELTSVRVNNYKRMETRRIQFSFGVLYSTPMQKMKRIPHIVGECVRQVKKARLDRAHFKEFADSSLNFEVVYYVNSPDYNAYMDIQQDINLGILRAFRKEGIGFAFPTRTMVMEKS